MPSGILDIGKGENGTRQKKLPTFICTMIIYIYRPLQSNRHGPFPTSVTTIECRIKVLEKRGGGCSLKKKNKKEVIPKERPGLKL